MTEERCGGTSCEGSAVLDIGPGVGALVVHTPPALTGQEIEVSPAGRPAPRVHTVVRERTVGGRRLVAALFPALPAGEHIVWCGGRPAAGGAVTVPSGGVGEITLTLDT
jgi:hypothetical protein